MTFSRFSWGMSPWMHWASTPRICRSLATRSVLPLVLQKTMARSYCSWSRIFCSASTFWFIGTSSLYWRMSGLFSSSGRTVISTGSRW